MTDIFYSILSGICAGMSGFYSFCWGHKDYKYSLAGSALIALAGGLVCFGGRKYLMGLDPAWIFLPATVFLICMRGCEAEDVQGTWREVFVKAGIPAVTAVSGYAMLVCMISATWNLFNKERIYQISLIGLFLICAAFGGYYLAKEFPENGWIEEILEVQESKVDRLPFFTAAWLFCSLAGLTSGTYSAAVAILEIFCFFGGLFIICLWINDCKGAAELIRQKHSFEELQSYMNVIRSQRHDYNIHVQTMQTLLSGEEDEACRQYFDSLLDDSVQMNHLIPLDNPAVGALIYSFRIKAAEEGVQMQIDISNNLEKIVTSPYETNKIIGNLLQNALDEVLRIRDKSYGIHLSILKKGEFCLIQVANKTENAADAVNHRYGISKKAGHEGIGLESIRRLAMKYNGAVYSRLNGDIICFVAKLPLWVAGGGR